MDKIEKLPKAHSLLKEAKDNATEIMHRATTGYITITQDEYGSETLYISNTRDYTAADKLWKWNMAGLGYSNDGGQTFGLAITMDGSIVADFITAGVLNGDIIRAGIIQDVKKSNYWNLETGAFRLSASAQVGNSTVASKKDVEDLDDSLDQDEVFNRLTNNGAAQGIYLENGKLYINASYIATGILKDASSNVVFDLNTGTLTMKKGSIDIGNGNFKVDTDGNVTIKKGTIDIGSGNFKVDAQGNVTIKKGSIDIGSGNFKVDSQGNVTIKRGSIDIGNGAFKVDSSGNLTATKGTFSGSLSSASGTFKGTVQASDFLDASGNSMMTKTTDSGTTGTVDRLQADYLDLHGIRITKKNTSTVTFEVDSNGAVTINGDITMGSGSTINWDNVTNTNLQSNPAYSLASSANSAATKAKNAADDAQQTADDAIAKANGIKVPTLPSYIQSTKITSTRIESPEIVGGSIYWGENGVNGSLTRGYGNDGRTQTNVVQLYSNAGVVILAEMGMRLEARNGIWFNLSSSDIHIKDGSHYSTLAELIKG